MSKLFPKKYGLMFHHFHSSKNSKTEGSITKKKFENTLKKVGLKNIISAHKFIKSSDKVCITFDDSLSCQYDIALPILNKYNLKAFWFLYSSSLNPKIDNIEIFRIFRNKKFANFNNFYKKFLNFLVDKKNLNSFLKKNYKEMKKLKKNYPFYSLNEIEFRFIRDKFLTKKQYISLIKKMYFDYKFNYKKEAKNIFLNKSQIKKLSKNGQIIGLHSHSHPTKISALSQNEQLKEYKKNKVILEKIIDKKIITSSHPSGDYNLNTLKILKRLGIILSFRSNIKKDNRYLNTIYENLTVPREDHVNF
jgi:peptidoglycan/xylan/chitin deacetylase (PgdA/CDA1 family)